MNRNKLGQFMSSGMKGRNNPKWKGNSVGYSSLHSWLYRTIGKPMKCDKCGETKKLEWANKSKKYLRNKNDWISLCVFCHREFDNHPFFKLDPQKVLEIKKLYISGKTQGQIASLFGLHQTTVHYIVKGKTWLHI